MTNNFTGIVYKITSPSNKIYVGSTKNFKNRLVHYKTTLGKSQSKLYNSFKKYGFEAHKFEILWEGPIEKMLEMESKIGFELDVLSVKNLNCKLPKNDEKIRFISEETFKKMSQWQIGRKMSEQSKKNMSISAKKRPPFSKETRLKISLGLSKPIIQMDLDGNFIREWYGAEEAGRQLDLWSAHISSCCRGERKTTGGFKWKYKNNK